MARQGKSVGSIGIERNLSSKSRDNPDFRYSAPAFDLDRLADRRYQSQGRERNDGD